MLPVRNDPHIARLLDEGRRYAPKYGYEDERNMRHPPVEIKCWLCGEYDDLVIRDDHVVCRVHR
jgi:hypothetical protein